MLDRKRVLLVLDNAASVEQVRPLLPGSPSCFVIVTSRDSLAGLTAREGASRIDLDRMTPGEAGQLLEELLEGRHEPDTEAMRQLAERCARLPLALRIAAERVRERPGGSVADLVAELADEQARLDLLEAGGDPQASVRVVFSWSYGQLDPAAAALFRLCGLHAGQNFDAYALAAMTGHDDVRATRRLLDTLVRARLIDHTAAGRYMLHDLLHDYAAELAQDSESEAERRAALSRLLDFYLHTASLAMQLFAPREVEVYSGFTHSLTALPPLPTYEAALEWLNMERVNMGVLAERAAHGGFPAFTTGLSATLWRYLDLGLYFDDARRLHGLTLDVARARGDRPAEAIALRALGLCDFRSGHMDRATRRLEDARGIQEALGDRKAQATTLNYLAAPYNETGRVDDAIRTLERSVELYEQVGEDVLQARPLGNLGAFYRQQRRYTQAVECFERALLIAERHDDRPGQAHVLTEVAELLTKTGRSEEAVTHLRRALVLSREVGLHRLESGILTDIGRAYEGLGDAETALIHHREALKVAEAAANDMLKPPILMGFARVHVVRGESAKATLYLRDALATAIKAGNILAQAHALAGLGDISAGHGSREEAIEHLRQALAIYTEAGRPEAEDVKEKLDRFRATS
jgi:tetratricopeptide (TPR) repeat protein